MSQRLAPRELVDLCAHAEQAGFSGTMVADSFQPWVAEAGQAAFVWDVLAAVGAHTTGDLGPGAVCPSFRMHPAVVAQASATLAALYPGRHWLGLGAGEAINEHIVGGYWPEPAARLARLWEAVDVIRKLFGGKDVRHHGEHVTLERTRLWTLEERPPILIATAGPVTARRAGRDADGIIVLGGDPDRAGMLLGRFAEGAEQAGKDPSAMPKILQLHVAWAPTHAEAVAEALAEWPNAGMPAAVGDIRSPYDFAQLARLVREENLTGRMLVSADLDAHRAHLQRFLDAGVDRIYLHNAGRDQRRFLDVFARDVLPRLHR